MVDTPSRANNVSNNQTQWKMKAITAAVTTIYRRDIIKPNLTRFPKPGSKGKW